jgi:hypothetical protein
MPRPYTVSLTGCGSPVNGTERQRPCPVSRMHERCSRPWWMSLVDVSDKVRREPAKVLVRGGVPSPATFPAERLGEARLSAHRGTDSFLLRSVGRVRSYSSGDETCISFGDCNMRRLVTRPAA